MHDTIMHAYTPARTNAHAMSTKVTAELTSEHQATGQTQVQAIKNEPVDTAAPVRAELSQTKLKTKKEKGRRETPPLLRVD